MRWSRRMRLGTVQLRYCKVAAYRSGLCTSLQRNSKQECGCCVGVRGGTLTITTSPYPHPSVGTTLRPYHLTTWSPYHLTTSPPYHLTTLQPYHLTTLQPYHLTTLPPYRLTTLPPYNLTTLQPYHLTTLQPYHLTTFPHYHLTTLHFMIPLHFARTTLHTLTLLPSLLGLWSLDIH